MTMISLSRCSSGERGDHTHRFHDMFHDMFIHKSGLGRAQDTQKWITSEPFAFIITGNLLPVDFRHFSVSDETLH